MAEQAVIIWFKYGFPDLSELLELEDQLERVLSPEKGNLDGNEVATDRTEGSLYLYGPSAEALWGAIEATVRKTPFMAGALVVLRFGPAEVGVTERRFTLDQGPPAP